MARSAEEAAASLKEWRARQTEEALGRQRSQVETAKLLASFSVAIGATLVGTALQVGSPTSLDLWATIVLAIAFLLAIAVILLDRLKEPNSDYLDSQALANDWDDLQRLAALETLSLAARIDGEEVVRMVMRTAVCQVATTLVASALAAVSLLRP